MLLSYPLQLNATAKQQASNAKTAVPSAGLLSMHRRSPLLARFTSAMALVPFQTMAYSVRLLPPAQGPVLAVASRDDKASALTSYEVVHEEGISFDGLQVCVWVDSAPHGKERPTRSGPFSFEGPRRDLPIQGLELGSHRVSAVVVEPSESDTTNKTSTPLSSVASIVFNVILHEVFVPSYEWQVIHPWQSVPPGLEVQLPLDGVAHKRGRIPPSWRLQVYVSVGGGVGRKDEGFFLRTDLHPANTVWDLRGEIARHPRFGRPISCVKLSLGGRVLEDEETVQSLDLFNHQRDLVPIVDPQVEEEK